ncbi:uncharacterized protein DS421_16g541720 [Arachis hypogaea]|nr:uncharacterized protein DS421_16g541720 [Arachis hypogaea]
MILHSSIYNKLATNNNLGHIKLTAIKLGSQHSDLTNGTIKSRGKHLHPLLFQLMNPGS